MDIEGVSPIDDFGKRLQELRKKMGITQKQMAEKIGVARSTYALYETNKIKPSLDVYNRIMSLNDQGSIFVGSIRVNYEGSDFKTLRIASGLSLEDVGNRTGIDVDILKKIEEGNYHLHYQEYQLIMAVYGVDVSVSELSDTERNLVGLDKDQDYLKAQAKIVHEMMKILSDHGYTLEIGDENSIDSYYIRETNTDKTVAIEYNDIFSFYETLKDYLNKSEGNFVKFKIKELENKQNLL